MPLDLECPIELSPLWLRDIALDAQASAFALWALWLAACGLGPRVTPHLADIALALLVGWLFVELAKWM